MATERRGKGVEGGWLLGWAAWPVGAALGLGLLLRLWFVTRHAWVAGDGLVYGDLARNLLTHRVYGFSQMVNGVAGAPRPTLIRLPGYPLFLAACFRVFGMEHYGAALRVQVAVDLWTCLLLGGVATRMFGRGAGRAAVWLGALCPFTANYAAAALTETLTLFCIGLAFYGLVRWGEGRRELDRWVFVLGFALAYAVLLRPEQGMLAAAVIPGMGWMAWERGKQGRPQGLKPLSPAEPERPKAEALGYLRATTKAEALAYLRATPKAEALGYLRDETAGLTDLPCGSGVVRPTSQRRDVGHSALWAVSVVALLTVLPLVPWAARNWRTFGVFQPLAPRYANDPGEMNPAGFQRWYRTWAVEFAATEDVYWNYDGSPIDVGDLPERAFDSEAQEAQTEELLGDYNKGTTGTPELDARFDAIARERIAAAPLRYYVALPVARVVNMALRPRTEMLPVPVEWWRFREHWKTSSFALAYSGLNLGYFVLAGVVLGRRELWRAERVVVWTMVATVVLRAGLLLTLDNSEARYTVEFFPVLIVLGAGMWRGAVTQR